MRRKLLIALLIGAMAAAPTTALAEDADLEARIEALEERVAALEAQLAGSVPQGVSPVQEQETIDPGTVETGMVIDGASLSFKRAELGQAYNGEDVVIMYFDYFNGSGETSSAEQDFYVKVFQNNREQENAYVSDNQAYDDRSVEFRSGADPVEVCYAAEITDTSDIIVNISAVRRWGFDDVEFTVSLE